MITLSSRARTNTTAGQKNKIIAKLSKKTRTFTYHGLGKDISEETTEILEAVANARLRNGSLQVAADACCLGQFVCGGGNSEWQMCCLRMWRLAGRGRAASRQVQPETAAVWWPAVQSSQSELNACSSPMGQSVSQSVTVDGLHLSGACTPCTVIPQNTHTNTPTHTCVHIGSRTPEHTHTHSHRLKYRHIRHTDTHTYTDTQTNTQTHKHSSMIRQSLLVCLGPFPSHFKSSNFWQQAVLHIKPKADRESGLRRIGGIPKESNLTRSMTKTSAGHAASPTSCSLACFRTGFVERLCTHGINCWIIYDI